VLLRQRMQVVELQRKSRWTHMLRIDASGGSARAATPSFSVLHHHPDACTASRLPHLHLDDMGGLTYGSYGAGSTLAVIGLCTRQKRW